MRSAQSLFQKLLDSDPKTLAHLASLGPARAILTADRNELKACGLSSRDLERVDACRELLRLIVSPPDTLPLDQPHRLARAVRELGLRLREEVWIVAVDSELRPVSRTIVAVGSHNACNVEPAHVLAPPLRAHTDRFFVAHNHPSGNASPSPEDQRFTRRIVESSRLMGLELLDHLVITASGWSSCLTAACGRFEVEATTPSADRPVVGPRPDRVRRPRAVLGVGSAFDAQRHRHTALASDEPRHGHPRKRRLHTGLERWITTGFRANTDLGDRSRRDCESDFRPGKR